MCSYFLSPATTIVVHTRMACMKIHTPGEYKGFRCAGLWSDMLAMGWYSPDPPALSSESARASIPRSYESRKFTAYGIPDVKNAHVTAYSVCAVTYLCVALHPC